MERTIPQSWKVDKLRMIRHKEQNFFYKNLRFHTKTKRNTLLTMSNMKFHQKLPTKCLGSLFITPTNNLKLGPKPNNLFNNQKT